MPGGHPLAVFGKGGSLGLGRLGTIPKIKKTAVATSSSAGARPPSPRDR